MEVAAAANQFEDELNSGRLIKFDSRDGLRRLRAIGDYRAPDPTSFRGTVIRARFEDVRIETIRATAHSCRRPGVAETEIGDAIAITFVDEGSLTVRRPPSAYRLGSGDASLTRTSAPFAYRTSGPLVMMRTIVTTDRLPRYLVQDFSDRSGPLPHTPLVTSLCAFVRQLAATPPARSGAEARYLAQALTDLQAAVIAEHLGAETVRVGTDGLRYRIHEYIGRHLTEPELGPSTIAAALQVSIRYLHRAFTDEDDTIARTITRRRVEAAAAQLRTDHPGPQVGELARQLGFSSRDQFARAFKRQYGITITAYRHRT